MTMTKPLRIFSVSTLMLFALDQGHCEDTAALPSFEVASITPCPAGTPMPRWEHDGDPRFLSPGGRFTARAATARYLMEWAYGLQPAQHTGGPAWFGTDRYDVLAKAEGAATEQQIKFMMRRLLLERFQLRTHWDTRTVSALVLSVGKNPPKLTPAKEGEERGLHVAPQTSSDQKAPTYHVVATRFKFAQLTAIFARQLETLIVDRTGLDGEYDFTLDLVPDENGNPMDASHLLTALREQLGLIVKSEKTPVELLVVDGAQKVAAAN